MKSKTTLQKCSWQGFWMNWTRVDNFLTKFTSGVAERAEGEWSGDTSEFCKKIVNECPFHSVPCQLHFCRLWSWTSKRSRVEDSIFLHELTFWCFEQILTTFLSLIIGFRGGNAGIFCEKFVEVSGLDVFMLKNTEKFLSEIFSLERLGTFVKVLLELFGEFILVKVMEQSHEWWKCERMFSFRRVTFTSSGASRKASGAELRVNVSPKTENEFTFSLWVRLC